MCTGHPPWKDLNPLAALNRIAHTDQKPPYPDHISESLKDFMNKCFTKAPESRPNVYDLLHHPFILGKSKVKDKKIKRLGITKNELSEYQQLKTIRDFEDTVIL